MGNLESTLASIDDRLRRIEMRQQRQGAPLAVLTADEMAAAVGVSRKTLERKQATGIFTDARPPEERGTRAKLRFYADEVPVYLAEGRAGLRRYRRDVGRA